MLSLIRRLIHSRFGVVITLGVLAVIALAFAAGDITGLRGNNVAGGNVATVGGTGLGEAEVRQRAQQGLANARQQQPGLDMSAFVNGGGLDAILERTINGLALQEFAGDVGMVMSKAAVDGEIASIPAFRGIDGKFSQTQYDQILAQQRLTDRQVRDDITRDSLARQLLAPTAGASHFPATLALPYASLLLEKRQGAVGYIPVTAVASAREPSAAELQAYYTRNRARYTVGERRQIRYALVRAADVAAAAQPTEAEVAAAYRSQAARFGASQKRTVTQVVVADQAAANALAARVRSGTAIAAAAQAAGLTPSSFTNLDKAALATQTAPAVAEAAFAAPANGVAGPVRSPLGWHVLRVDAVQSVAARTLDQARAELAAELAKTKAAEALSATHDSIDDKIGESATFDEIVGDAKLQAQTTPPLLASGINPDAPSQPDPTFARLAQAAFATEAGDAPQIVPIGNDGSFAVVGVGTVVPAAPRPLQQIRRVVLRDYAVEAALRTVRTAATGVVAKVSRGTPLERALAETGLTLPKVQPVNASRAQLAAAGAQLPPSVGLMFSMRAGTAKLMPAPNNAGWYVVYLRAIQNGNAVGNTLVINQTRAGLGSVIGRELVEQFTRSVRGHVGVKRDDAAIAKVRGDLTGAGGSAQ